jgi:LysR family transcriptional activator of nhaA
MRFLNYHHLFYFWHIAKLKSLSEAGKFLKLRQPTLSAQLKQLEDSLGIKLINRGGRNFSLTREGHFVFKYAENIFTTGAELLEQIENESHLVPNRLKIGVVDAIPKIITYTFLEPVSLIGGDYIIECVEGSREDLLKKLSCYELDLVLSDSMVGNSIAIKANESLLATTSITMCATDKLIEKYGSKLEAFWGAAPVILPAKNSVLRETLDIWFSSNNIIPHVVGEFEDSALLKTFGSKGLGFFPVPTLVAHQVVRDYSIKVAFEIPEITESFYAITLEKDFTHAGLIAKCAEALLRSL